MGLWTAVRHHRLLVATGVLAGVILTLVWTYSFSWGDTGPMVRRRSRSTYLTTVNAIIDTEEFGLGRSDTDVYRLALMAPTYAQMLVSEPVLQQAEKALGRPIGAEVQAQPVASSPIVQLTVSGTNKDTIDDTALALVSAFSGYITENQVQSNVPDNLRLTIRAIDRPTTAQPTSNRQTEIAILLFCLPIGAALLLAYRLERGASLAAHPEGSKG